MRSFPELEATLRRIDRRGYKAYRDIRGDYADGPLSLHVDHVQADPFASPSRMRLRLARAASGLVPELDATRVRRIALEDFLARAARDCLGAEGTRRHGSGKSGVVLVDAGGQEVLERTAVRVAPDFVELRLRVGLPAAGRSVLGREAARLLLEMLPRLARRSLCIESLDREVLDRFVECVENQEAIRDQLEGLGLVAFVADGALLPRESGASDRPLREHPVPFESPASLRVTLEVPNPTPDGSRSLSGLGIPRGVTLIVGGGYHGKSTLLRALERGVYPHVPGDGREGVVTCAEAVKIRAEDGRRVERVDIQAFISDLPGGRSTAEFSSDDASGSTSQAANIVEALEMGARLLLLDEDTSATNFMVRDARMQALVSKDQEPITPFVDRVHELYERLGVSTILVMGGSGDYFDVADRVIRMHAYRPEDATAEARRIAAEIPTARRREAPDPLSAVRERVPLASSLDASRGRREVKIDVPARSEIRFGRERIDLTAVEQLVDASQTRAVGYALYALRERFLDGRRTLRQAIEALEAWLDAGGLEGLDPRRRGEGHPGDFARPRRHELAAAFNRLRSVRVRLPASGDGEPGRPAPGREASRAHAGSTRRDRPRE